MFETCIVALVVQRMHASALPLYEEMGGASTRPPLPNRSQTSCWKARIGMWTPRKFDFKCAMATVFTYRGWPIQQMLALARSGSMLPAANALIACALVILGGNVKFLDYRCARKTLSEKARSNSLL